MAIKAIKQFTAWSYSRYSDYVKCPFMAKCKHLDRLPTRESPALANGNTVHKLAEDWAKRDKTIKTIPDSLKLFESEFKDLRKRKTIKCEENWTVTSSWTATGWFDKDAWCRAKIDVHWLDGTTLHVKDHKTGKIYPSNVEQLKQYGAMGFAVFPQAKVITAALWYLDQGEIKDMTFKRDKDAKELQAEWNGKVAPMLADKTFAPRPGSHCTWCDFSKSKGGPCRY